MSGLAAEISERLRTAERGESHALAVRAMFDRISPTYDLLNGLLSLGIEDTSSTDTSGAANVAELDTLGLAERTITGAMQGLATISTSESSTLILACGSCQPSLLTMSWVWIGWPSSGPACG